MFCLLLSSVLSLPKRIPGFSYGVQNAKVVVDMYCDPLCSDCLDVWPNMKKLLTKYPKDLQIWLHLMPLPSHTWAFAVIKGIMALKSISEQKARDMIDALYSGDQSQFSTSKLINVPEAQVNEKICMYIASTFQVDYQTIYNQYSNIDVRKEAGIQFSFAAMHSIVGTPTYEVNGVKTSMNEDTTYEQWCQFIDSIL